MSKAGGLNVQDCLASPPPSELWGKPGELQLRLGTAFEVGHPWGQAWDPHSLHVVAAERGLGALVPLDQPSLERAVTMRNVRLTCPSFMPASVFLTFLLHSRIPAFG